MEDKLLILWLNSQSLITCQAGRIDECDPKPAPSATQEMFDSKESKILSFKKEIMFAFLVFEFIFFSNLQLLSLQEKQMSQRQTDGVFM